MLNITFSVALILLLFILPGAIFRRSYHSSHFSNYHLRASNFAEIVITLGIGVFVQAIGVFFLKIINLITPFYQVDFNKIGELLTAPTPSTFSSIGNNIGKILLYNVCLCIAPFVLGRFLMYKVLSGHLDYKWPMLRFDNEWNYIFSGKVIVNKYDELIKYINILVEIDNEFIIYSGIVSGYTLKTDGALELIEISRVKRKIISKADHDNHITTKEYKFNVHKLFIPYQNIKNFSITYYDLEEVVDKTKKLSGVKEDGGQQ